MSTLSIRPALYLLNLGFSRALHLSAMLTYYPHALQILTSRFSSNNSKRLSEKLEKIREVMLPITKVIPQLARCCFQLQ